MELTFFLRFSFYFYFFLILELFVEKGLAFWTLKSGLVQVAMGERILSFKYHTNITQHREAN